MAFSLFNTKIKIEYAFLLVLLLSAVLGNANLIWLVVFSSLHEIGHIAALLLFGGKVDEITISYYGVGMKHTANLKPIQEALFLLSGVAVNALFAAFNIHRDINAALFIVNILPIYPLDGGRILDVAFEQLLCADRAYKMTVVISLITTLSILVAALVFGNISLFMIVGYIVFYYINFRGIFNEKRS